MIRVLKEHPEGLSEGELRTLLGVPSHEQAQFGRRRRYLKDFFIIEKKQIGRKWVYIYRGEKAATAQPPTVDRRKRAEVIRDAHGRCQMCGKSIERHGIVLVVDHKIPRDWGGANERENLWAICEDCNAGKKAHFATQDQSLMREIMRHKMVHVRLGELLKLNVGNPVSASLLSFVADQSDWMKRVRELRYLGWKVKTTRKKNAAGKSEAFYTLTRHTDWPENPAQWIRNYERERERKNRAARASSPQTSSPSPPEQ